MNANEQNGDVSSGVFLLNRYTLHQYKESSNLNDINMVVENGYVNGGNCYMNISTVSESKNHNSIDSTNKRDEIFPKRYEMKKMDYRMVLSLMLC